MKPIANHRELWTMVGFALAAAVLRMVDLTGRSMWLDEGYTLARLAGSWPDILRNIVYLQGQFTVDFHPPVYFAILKLWTALAGHSEFVLKLVPAAFGVLVVPATYALARRLFGRSVSLFAALLALVCPAYQWYSHELRMYSLVACLSALSTYFAYRAVTDRDRAPIRWLAWLSVTVISLLTHYAFFGLLAAQIAFFGVSLFLRPPKSVHRGLVAAVESLILVLGGAVILSGFNVPIGSRQVAINLQSLGDTNASLLGTIKSVMDAALFGLNVSDPTQGVISWLAVGVCVLGGVLPDRRAKPGATRARLLALLAGAGTVIIIDFSLIAARWWIDFRYFIVAVPALHALVARAIVILWPPRAASPHLRSPGRSLACWSRRALSAGVLFAVVFITGWGTAQSFTRTSIAQDDWRSMAQYLRNHWQDGDALLVGPFTPELVLVSYLDGAPIVILYAHAADSSDAIGRHTRIWYASTGREKSDQSSTSGRALAGNFLREHLLFPGRTDILELSLYEPHAPLFDTLPETAVAVPDTNTDAAGVSGFEIGKGWVYNPQPNLRLSLYWRNGQSMDVSNYSVAVRFSNGDGRGWADWFMPAQLESAPATWNAGNLYRVDYVIPVPLGLPRQPYIMELGVRSGVKPELVQTVKYALIESDAQWLRITAWSDAGRPASTELWRSDEVALVKAEYLPTLKPGEILPVVLTWKLIGAPRGPWKTGLSLDGLITGNVVTSTELTGAGEFPVEAWPPGQPVRDMKSLLIPFSARAGVYRLSLNRQFEDGRPSQSVELGWIELKDYPRTPVPQDIPHPINAQVGEIKLLGYGLNQAFDRSTNLEFHTYWRVDADPSRDGVLFMHLIGPDGVKVAQDDNPPEQGKRSTLTYRAGDGIDQIHRMVVPTTAPGGVYKLYAGIYNLSDVVRWPAQQDGALALNDLIYLGSLTLPELRKAYLPIIQLTVASRLSADDCRLP